MFIKEKYFVYIKFKLENFRIIDFKLKFFLT